MVPQDQIIGAFHLLHLAQNLIAHLASARLEITPGIDASNYNVDWQLVNGGLLAHEVSVRLALLTTQLVVDVAAYQFTFCILSNAMQ